MATETEPAEREERKVSSGTERVVGLVTANISLAIGALFYMGWVYSDAKLSYFQLDPLDLGIGAPEYVLRSSASLFSPTLILSGVAWLVLTTMHNLRLGDLMPSRFLPIALSRNIGRLTTAVAAPLTQRRLGLGLIIMAGVSTLLISRGLAISTYLVLALTGVGVLLLSRSDRERTSGLSNYAVSLVIVAACILWAAGLHASARGRDIAIRISQNLPARTSVVVYSAKPMAISGPGVKLDRLPKGYQYGYRYQGLRLLIARSDRYFLLPVCWQHGINGTYIIKETDSIRVEILPGDGPAGTCGS